MVKKHKTDTKLEPRGELEEGRGGGDKTEKKMKNYEDLLLKISKILVL